MERPVLKVCGWMSAPGARWTLKRVEMRVERVCCGTIQWSNAGRHSDQGWARGWEGRSDALPFVLCGMRVGRGRGVVQQLAQPVLPFPPPPPSPSPPPAIPLHSDERACLSVSAQRPAGCVRPSAAFLPRQAGLRPLVAANHTGRGWGRVCRAGRAGPGPTRSRARDCRPGPGREAAVGVGLVRAAGDGDGRRPPCRRGGSLRLVASAGEGPGSVPVSRAMSASRACGQHCWRRRGLSPSPPPPLPPLPTLPPRSPCPPSFAYAHEAAHVAAHRKPRPGLRPVLVLVLPLSPSRLLRAPLRSHTRCAFNSMLPDRDEGRH